MDTNDFEKIHNFSEKYDFQKINSEKYNFDLRSFINKEILDLNVKNIENIEVLSFNGLLVDACKKLDCDVIIRGLRALSDYEYEFKMALMNRSLDNSMETVFLMTDEKYSHISSSFVKEIYNLGGDVSAFIPEPALYRLDEIENEKNNK